MTYDEAVKAAEEALEEPMAYTTHEAKARRGVGYAILALAAAIREAASDPTKQPTWRAEVE